MAGETYIFARQQLIRAVRELQSDVVSPSTLLAVNGTAELQAWALVCIALKEP